MEQDRKTYRLVRLLTGGVTPVVLATMLLVFAGLRDGAWEPGAQAAGICRELIAGTTEGRQALFGSCWMAPLPVLVYLPFSWLLPEPAAGMAAFFVAWLFAFWAVREAVKAVGQSGWRIVLAQTAIAAGVAVSGQPQALQISTALMAGLLLLAAAALADWAAYRRMRDVVMAGTSGALLVLCGLPAFCPAGVAVGLVPFLACGSRDSRARFQAWLLLGVLPLVYTLCVWLLLNRLILGDAIYFLRSLGYLVPRLNLFVCASLIPAGLMLPAVGITWFCDSRDPERPGAGAAAATALLVSFALALLAYDRVLIDFGIGWSSVALKVGALVVLLIAMARLRQPVYRLAFSLALVVWLSARWFVGAGLTEEAAAARGELCRRVESYVSARTPYGRVFVVGYTGLDLLRGYTGDRLVANLDLHIGALRRAYKGQNLYVLVPRPEGPARAESVFWKHPDIYTQGGDRLLFAEAFGRWHLFEVVGAPTQEQLDEWKSGSSLVH